MITSVIEEVIGPVISNHSCATRSTTEEEITAPCSIGGLITQNQSIYSLSLHTKSGLLSAV